MAKNDPISVTVNGVDLERVKFDRIGDRLEDRILKKLAPMLQNATLKTLNDIAKELDRIHSRGWTPTPNRTNKLRRRTGKGMRAIRNSIEIRNKGNIKNMQGVIMAPINSETKIGVHEEGAVIKAKNSKYLAVPLPAALDSRGVPLKDSPRDWDRTFVKRSRNGNLIVFQSRGRQIIPLYWLTKEVTIPPRLKLRVIANKHIAVLNKKVGKVVDREVQRALLEMSKELAGAR